MTLAAATFASTQLSHAEELKPKTYDSASYTARYLPEKTVYQDDGRIFHRGGYNYAVVTKLTDPRITKNTFTASALLSDGTHAQLQLSATAAGTLRLQFGRLNAKYADASPMLLATAKPARALELVVENGVARIKAEGHEIQIGLDPFTLSIRSADGRLVAELETEQMAGSHITPPLGFRSSGGVAEPFLSWRIHNTDRFYGLGEKFNKVEKSSTRATVWASDTCGSNTTDLAYKSIPLLHCSAGWSLMLHSSARSFWEVGSFSYTSGSCLVQDEKLDAFIFLAPDVRGLIERYTALTGRTAMPPLWAFGVWMSRCAYNSRAEVEEVLARLRAEQIPCDVIHLDPLWMRTHYYFKIGVDACDFVRNEENFPGFPEMLTRWKDQGFSTCFWLNPYLPEGQPIYEEAKAEGYLLRSTKGGIARLEYGEPVGIVDFTNPAAKTWWKGKLKALVADGASVFKPDYGDRVSEDSLSFDGQTGRTLHNLYLHLYCQAAAEAVEESRGETIVWRRAGYIGSQRYPGTWAGDTQVTWEGMRCALRGGLSAGFGGEACWSHDIGGFVGPKPSDELYIRWAQWGLLSPFARFHGTTPREPWHYGQTAIEVVRRYAQLRYTLIPYLVKCVEESAQTGLPVLRHLSLEYPNDPVATNIDDQYLLGPSLLVAPVFVEGARSRMVYFPDGEWYVLENPSECYSGGRYHSVPAPLDRLPLFVKRGATLPRYSAAPQHLKATLPATIQWTAP